MIGLVNEHRNTRPNFGEKGFEVGLCSQRTSRGVGIADVEEAGGGVGSCQHGIEVMCIIARERCAAHLRANEPRGVRDEVEGRGGRN